ncbi:unnamed protein product [Urochloa decumbens]|uniref:F-box domain-containing protein n=1 Tax=Urochloa decumbens TaxID=240449 RepID=A0ABC9D1R4_9POAL
MAARRKRRRVDKTGRLSDDVLVRILERVPDARDLLRTGALARRWRGLWTRVPALRFACSTRPEFRSAAGGKLFVAFVDDALALRAAQREPGLEHLAISFITEAEDFRISGEDLQRLVPLLIGAGQGWIHHAVGQQALKSFDLEIRLPDYDVCHRPKPKVLMGLDCLPSSATLVTMRLALDGALVQLPATAVFKVRLMHLGIHENVWSEGPMIMSLEAAALSELSMEKMDVAVAHILQLKTPNLQVLSMNSCIMAALIISAPNKLEELYFTSHNDYGIDVDCELPRVWSLKAELCSRGRHDDDDIDIDTIRLLQNCSESVRRLELSLHVTERKIVDKIKGRIPHLPHVTSLTIHVPSLRKLHSVGVGISDILTQCINSQIQESGFFCQHPYHIKSQQISLPHLQDVEFKGLIGTDCELWFVESVLSSATELEEVAITFCQTLRAPLSKKVCDLMPELRGGDWTTCSSGPYSSYKWRCHLVGD